MEVHLHIEDKPSFCELHTSAFPLSILEAYDGFSKQWLIQNFINICFKREYDNALTYNKAYFWFWDCFKVRYSLHYPYKNVVKKIQDYLDSGYYVFLCVNEKYIPERVNYKKCYYNHDILIFGYNDELYKFDTIGYNDRKKYETQKVLFSDIDKAFRTNPEHLYKFYALKINPDYDFNKRCISIVKRNIKKYLYTKNMKKGFRAYQYLYEYIKPSLEKNIPINMRSFRMIKDRAITFALISEYFEINIYLENLLKRNVQISKSLFLMVLKWNRSTNPNLKEPILQYINIYMENEKRFFTEFLKIL